jgi:hypothetical protein
LPEPPDGVTITQLEPSSLIEIRSLQTNENEAAEIANKVASDYAAARRTAAKAKYTAERDAAAEGSAEWVRLNEAKDMPMPATMVHERTVPNPTPASPNAEKAIWFYTLIGLFVAFVIAASLTQRRGVKEQDGEIMPSAELLKSYGKWVAACLAIGGIWTAASQSLLPPEYSAAATVQLFPESEFTFANQSAILQSSGTLAPIVKDLDLVKIWNTANQALALKLFRERLRFTEDVMANNVEVQFTDVRADLVAAVPAAIAKSHESGLKQWHMKQSDARATTLAFQKRQAELDGRTDDIPRLQQLIEDAQADTQILPTHLRIVKTTDAVVSEPKLIPGKLWKNLVACLFYACVFMSLRQAMKGRPSEAPAATPMLFQADPY